MAIVQVSERIIREKYITLDEYLGKDIIHNESDLFYNDGLVYKIYKKMYRLYRQSYLWILDQNKFNYCLNIENLLYQGDKLIGNTTLFHKDLQSIESIILSKGIIYEEAKEIYKILLSVHEELLKYNLYYLDTNLSNICLENGNVLLSDFDGVCYSNNKNAPLMSLYNIYVTYISLLLNEDFKRWDKDESDKCLKNIMSMDVNVENLKNYIDNMTLTKYEILKDNFIDYKRTLIK